MLLFSFYNIQELVIWILATEIAIIGVFIANSLWTFRIVGFFSLQEYVKKFLVFNTSSMFAILIQSFAGYWGVLLFGERYRQVILLCTIVFIVAPYNWFMYHRFIWQKK